MQTVDVLTDPGAATVALDPLRARLLGLLGQEPASAAQLARAVDESRQKVRYHLTSLLEHGLVREVEQRQHGGLTERLYEASAAAYVVAPSALGTAAVDATALPDQLSSAYAVAVAARAVDELGALRRSAASAGLPLATLTLDAEIAFASAADRAAFARELQASVLALVAKYHDDEAPEARRHRLVALAHPTPRPPEQEQP